MRGKAGMHGDLLQNGGITPAYAGKRRKDHSGGHDKQDHPRLCGEKSRISLAAFPFIGSPPPMRGKG